MQADPDQIVVSSVGLCFDGAGVLLFLIFSSLLNTLITLALSCLTSVTFIKGAGRRSVMNNTLDGFSVCQLWSRTNIAQLVCCCISIKTALKTFLQLIKTCM